MKTIKLLTALICAMTLSLNVKPVFAQEGIEFDSEYTDGKVVYTFDKDETAITNGRIAVTYNVNEMKLVSAENANIFDVEDLNQLGEQTEDGFKTIYFAFASADALAKEGNVLTLEFELEASMKGKDVIVTTNVEEMNNSDTVIQVEKDVDIVNIPSDPVVKPDDKDPEEDEKDKDDESSDTSDAFNITLYGGLMVLALIGIGLIVYKKKCK